MLQNLFGKRGKKSEHSFKNQEFYTFQPLQRKSKWNAQEGFIFAKPI